MQFESFSAFLNMGGYGFYVWLSFGVSTVLLLGLIFNSIYGHKQVLKHLLTSQERESKLRQLRLQRNKTKKQTTKEITS